MGSLMKLLNMKFRTCAFLLALLGDWSVWMPFTSRRCEVPTPDLRAVSCSLCTVIVQIVALWYSVVILWFVVWNTRTTFVSIDSNAAVSFIVSDAFSLIAKRSLAIAVIRSDNFESGSTTILVASRLKICSTDEEKHEKQRQQNVKQGPILDFFRDV